MLLACLKPKGSNSPFSFVGCCMQIGTLAYIFIKSSVAKFSFVRLKIIALLSIIRSAKPKPVNRIGIYAK